MWTARPAPLSHYQGWCLVKGVKCPFVGLFAWTRPMIDVSEVPDAAIGDEVLVFGNEEGAMTYPQGASITNFNRNGLRRLSPPGAQGLLRKRQRGRLPRLSLRQRNKPRFRKTAAPPGKPPGGGALPG